jgi:hypothetical protein
MLEFQLLVTNMRFNDDNSACYTPMTMAELEFVTFTHSVAAMFGNTQARLAAEDWLNEVASSDSVPEPMSYEWRLITVAALARLAIRLTVELQHSNTSLPFN